MKEHVAENMNLDNSCIASSYDRLIGQFHDSLPFDSSDFQGCEYKDEDEESDFLSEMEEGIHDRWIHLPNIVSEILSHLGAANDPEHRTSTAREFFLHLFEFTQWHIGSWPHYLHSLAAKASDNGDIDIKAATDVAIDNIRRAFYELLLPQGTGNWILNSLAYLEEAHRPSYEPDEDKRAESLDYAYYAAAFAFTLKEREGSYSEESVRAFKESFRSYWTVNKDIGGASMWNSRPMLEARIRKDIWRHYEKAFYDDKAMKQQLNEMESELIKSFLGQMHELSEEDLQTQVSQSLSKIEKVCSQVVLQVLVGMHLCNIHVGERNWMEALRMYAHALACLELIIEEPEIHEAAFNGKDLRQAYGCAMLDAWGQHKESLHKDATEALIHLKETSGGGTDWREVHRYVSMILRAIESHESINSDSDYIPNWIEANEYTRHWWDAQGWIRGAKLEPGELRDELRKEEDEKAEQRLRCYFFNDPVWRTLPERAQRSLVEADRIWFSSRRGNPGAVLEGLKIAVEEVLFDLLWKPCFQWIDVSGNRGLDVLDVLNIRNELKKQNKNPSLLEFESVLESKGLASYLEQLDISEEDKVFVRKLRKPLAWLRRARTSVAHETGGPVLGIGSGRHTPPSRQYQG